MQGKILRKAAAFYCTTQHRWEKRASFQALSNCRDLRLLFPVIADVQYRESPFPTSPVFVRFGVFPVPLSQFCQFGPATEIWASKRLKYCASATRRYFKLRLRWAYAVTGEASLGPVLLVLLEQATIMKEIWPMTHLQRCWETFIWCCFHSVPWSYYWFHLH